MSDDYPRKYWWVVLIVVPVAAAAVGLLPTLLQKASSPTPPEAGQIHAVPDPAVIPPPGPDPIASDPSQAADTLQPASQVKLNSQREPAAQVNRSVQARGVGFPPPQVTDQARRRALARRAAEVDALRHLAEQIEGAGISGTSKTEMAALSRDEVRVRVTAIVKLATVIRETTNPDGSVEVVMEAPLQ